MSEYEFGADGVPEAIARLLGDVPDDANQWGDGTRVTLQNSYGYAMFFSRDLSRLSRRAEPLAKLMHRLTQESGEPVGKRPLNDSYCWWISNTQAIDKD